MYIKTTLGDQSMLNLKEDAQSELTGARFLLSRGHRTPPKQRQKASSAAM
jgi:hypothetical protein